MKKENKFWNKYTKIGALIGFILVIYPYVLFFFAPVNKVIEKIISYSLTTILLGLSMRFSGFRCGSDRCEPGFFLIFVLVPAFFVVVGYLIGYLVYRLKAKK
jgi:hypothetical protein